MKNIVLSILGTGIFAGFIILWVLSNDCVKGIIVILFLLTITGWSIYTWLEIDKITKNKSNKFHSWDDF